MCGFDIFLSYNWESKDLIKSLYAKLTQELEYKVWIDDHQLDSRGLYEQLCEGIKNSKCVVCCVTKKYSQSENCIREINFASVSRKPLIIIMLDRLDVSDIGSVGFIIASLTRFNIYKNDTNSKWSGEIYNSMIKSIADNIRQKRNPLIGRIIDSKNKFLAKKYLNPYNSEKKIHVNEVTNKSSNESLIESSTELSSTEKSLSNIETFTNRFGYYEGEMNDHKMNGYGVFYYNNQDVYKGQWKDDKKYGEGLFIYNDGEKYDGEWRDNKKHGKGKFTYINSDEYEGEFVNDRITGKGVFSYSFGDQYVGDFRNGQKYGFGKYIFKGGDSFSCNWIDNKEADNCVYEYENGDKYEGGFLNSKSHGKGVFIFSNGERYEGDYVYGKKQGKGTYFYLNGNTYVGEWMDNKKSGFGKITFSDGECYEGTFKNGLFDGYGTYLYKSGTEFKGLWANGSKVVP